MNFKNQRRWRIIKNYCIGWTIAIIIFIIIRGAGTSEHSRIQLDLLTTIAFAPLMGIIFGFFSALGQIYTIEKVYKQTTIQKLLIFRLIFSVFFVIMLIVSSYLIIARGYLQLDISLMEFAFERESWANYFYMILVDTLLTIIGYIDGMLGAGNLSKLLIGRFYYPREEERILMFLDLKSSTTIAEKLGHIQYSLFIQDCFNDLALVEEYGAEIYQYVGDEVVLSWELFKGLSDNQCVKAFFAVSALLKNRGTYYMEKYQCQPAFTAGLHSGWITIAEVGKYKKEIAFHGDTINTASRIQGLCNKFHQDLLISALLVQRLNIDEKFVKEEGVVNLKGKSEAVKVYSVRETTID